MTSPCPHQGHAPGATASSEERSSYRRRAEISSSVSLPQPKTFPLPQQPCYHRLPPGEARGHLSIHCLTGPVMSHAQDELPEPDRLGLASRCSLEMLPPGSWSDANRARHVPGAAGLSPPKPRLKRRHVSSGEEQARTCPCSPFPSLPLPFAVTPPCKKQSRLLPWLLLLRGFSLL